MSWDIDLVDDRGHTEGSWNYTHNINRMINVALDDNAIVLTAHHGSHWSEWCTTHDREPSWWMCMDNQPGPEGQRTLHLIIGALERNPTKYRQMNPANGWGDYDRLLDVLREMRKSVPGVALHLGRLRLIHIFSNGLPACGSPLTRGAVEFWAEQIDPDGVRCDTCFPLKFEEPMKPLAHRYDLGLRCDCGETFALNAVALAKHTDTAHGRRPTVSERTPR